LSPAVLSYERQGSFLCEDQQGGIVILDLLTFMWVVKL